MNKHTNRHCSTVKIYFLCIRSLEHKKMAKRKAEVLLNRVLDDPENQRTTRSQAEIEQMFRTADDITILGDSEGETEPTEFTVCVIFQIFCVFQYSIS